MSHYRRIVFLWCTLVLISTAGASAEAEYSRPTDSEYEYLYWDWGQTPRRDDYQFTLLYLALEQTIPAFGAYRLERVKKTFTRKRSILEVNIGRFVNVRAGAWQKSDSEDQLPAETNIAVPIPIMANLLGHRRLIIRKQDVNLFHTINREAQLQRLMLGQGNLWLDMDIYRHNQYSAGDSAQFPEHLIPMLVNGRFDYIPMSVIEIQDFMAQSGQYSKQVIEAPDITLFYPFPVVFYVSRNQPALAERLEQGLDILVSDGSLQKLLLSQFGDEISRLSNPDNRYFYLENPDVPGSENSAQSIFNLQ